MEQEATYIEIARYLKGEMSESERLAFEARIEQDEALKSALILAAKAHYAVHRSAAEGLKETFASWYQTQQEVQSTSTRWWRPMLAVAATLALLFLVYVFWPRSQALPVSEWFVAHYQPLSLDAVRAPASPADSSWQAASQAYQQQAFTEAVRGFEAVLQDTAFVHRAKAQLYLGLSQLALDETVQALAALKLVPKGSAFYADAIWYRALAHARLGQEAAARRLMQAIAASADHYHRSLARQLLGL